MKTMRVKSVTFYQTVRADGSEEKTIGSGIGKFKKMQIAFLDDKIFMRSQDWKNTYSKNTVMIVGLHNVRHLTVSKEDFLSSDYKDVFSCCVKAPAGEDVVVTPIAPVPPVIPEAGPPVAISDMGPPAGMDRPDFNDLPKDDQSIILKQDLAHFKIEFDKRWGVAKLMEVFIEGRKKYQK